MSATDRPLFSRSAFDLYTKCLSNANRILAEINIRRARGEDCAALETEFAAADIKADEAYALWLASRRQVVSAEAWARLKAADPDA